MQLVLCDSANLATRYERITKHMMWVIPPAIQKRSKHWLNEPIFITTSGDSLHSFITRVILVEVYDPESKWNSKFKFNKS